MDLATWLALVAAALSFITLVLVWRLWRNLTPRSKPAAAAPTLEPPAPAEPTQTSEQIVFVVNPSKKLPSRLRQNIMQYCASHYLPEPLWLETTPDEPGTSQARRASEAGARVVVAIGGDGTVRAVAQGLIDSPTRLGIVPLGTGNLLARNLGIPPGSAHLDEQLDIALGSHSQHIDTGWVTITNSVTLASSTHLFLVMSGLGFDANTMADTDDTLKKNIGWFAYLFAGAKHMWGKRIIAQLHLDGEVSAQRQLRSLIIGNCGELPGRIRLLPQAVIDDGQLDIAVVDARGGVIGWFQVMRQVFAQSLRGSALTSTAEVLARPGEIGRVDYLQGKDLAVRIRQPERVQVDGDPVGFADKIQAWVRPESLHVGVPAPTPELEGADS